jgi:DNA-binding NarL/FixJ family response regulator
MGSRAHPRHHWVVSMSDCAPIRVVLCDDAVPFRDLMRCLLAADPAITVVGEAGDGLEGIEVVGELKPDVVLLDVLMPRCDGMEAIPHMLERSPATRIVGLSSFGAHRVGARVLSVGASAYLEKGAEIDAILAAIHRAAPDATAA